MLSFMQAIIIICSNLFSCDIVIRLQQSHAFSSLLVFQFSEKPLEGFHIVVDAGNGAGGFFAVSLGC